MRSGRRSIEVSGTNLVHGFNAASYPVMFMHDAPWWAYAIPIVISGVVQGLTAFAGRERRRDLIMSTDTPQTVNTDPIDNAVKFALDMIERVTEPVVIKHLTEAGLSKEAAEAKGSKFVLQVTGAIETAIDIVTDIKAAKKAKGD